MVQSQSPRRISLHQSLGGVADLLLWKRPVKCVLALTYATSSWYLFERAGYNVLSFTSNVLFLLVPIFFLWAKSASLLNRPYPPVPDLEVSQDCVVKASCAIQFCVDHALYVARDIAVERNVKLLVEVVFGLWLISFMGSLANFLTLAYIGVILSLLVPVFYDKFQDRIDGKLSIVCKIIKTQCRNIDNILRNLLMPMPINKVKKIH